MQVVLEKVLPTELTQRGVDDAESVCRELVASMPADDAGAGTVDSPEQVFERLGR